MGDASRQALPQPDLLSEGLCAAAWLEWVRVELLPVVKHALREGSASRRQSECVCQSERLRNRQVSSHVCQRSALDGLLGLYLSAALREALVDSTDGVARALDLHEEDWLLEARLGCQLSRVHCSASRWNDLVATSVGVVLMRHHIHDVIAGTTLVLVR